MFYNNGKQFKKFGINHNIVSNVVNDKFDIQGIDSTEIKILIYILNYTDHKLIELFDENTIQVIYNETGLKSDINRNNISSNLSKINNNSSDISSYSGKISTNISDISSNLGKIDNNSSDISSNLGKINDNNEDTVALQNSNIKSFYNLDKIFIYDIEKGDQNVDKNNYYHIFEKEIIHNFIKDSYLQIILKVLTEISNYVLIGFFFKYYVIFMMKMMIYFTLYHFQMR